MTQGFTRPFSPAGKASIVAPFPWYFAIDLLLVHFRTDATALHRYLPEPLEPLDDSGEAFVWTPKIACHPVGVDPEMLDPAQTSYNVCVVGIPARLHGKPTMFSAFQWCDKDWLIVLSWFIGATSKGAEFHETGRSPRLAELGSPNSDQLGGQIHRTVSRFGKLVVDVRFRPEREIALRDLDFYTSKLPLTGMRHIPDVTLPPKGRPALHDLAQQIMSGTRFGTPLAGTASVAFGDGANEELLPIQPTEVLGGYMLPMATLLEGIRIVHDYNA
jgi:hypothetical protein